ncbi:MAG: hypothetical protein KME05_23215 [Gloeocapsa sp. UFS-A4-WI-NPMV-4B04]|jgi:hypothetical protein|nr:hypothetical protein [Gloeocapsa sp. UFS-A4-WI-NPMV-4B04]
MPIQLLGISKALIVVEANEAGSLDSPTVIRMVSALKQAIATSTDVPITVQAIAANTLQSNSNLELESTWTQDWGAKDVLVCPLTLNIPPNLPFKNEAIYKACRDSGLRQQVAQQIGCETGNGNFYLPLVLTAKGPLYGEVIGLAEEMPENLSSNSNYYYQPFHLSDALRQQIYQIGHRLLQLLSAPPAAYLMQFGFKEGSIYFDRLWPFPAAPAIASLGVQEPNLFACHWYCLTNQPILDLTIIPAVASPTLP